MEILDRLVDEAAEEHGLPACWSEVVPAVEHVAARAVAVCEVVSGIGICFRQFLLVLRLGGGDVIEIEIRDAWEVVVEESFEGLVHVLALASVLAEHEQVHGARKRHVEHTSDIERCDPVERLALGSIEQRPHDSFDLLNSLALARIPKHDNRKLESFRLVNREERDPPLWEGVIGIFIFRLAAPPQSVNERAEEGVHELVAIKEVC